MSVAILPPEPDFGAPCPIFPSPETLELLAGRRSSSAQTLRDPAPTPAELDDMLRLAARAPDHGKLNPWRFLIIGKAEKPALVQKLRALSASQPSPDKASAVLAKLALPPLTVVVISAPRPNAKPIWEQELSAGAVCTLLLVAVEAMGYGANWITDWYSYDPQALELLGLSPGEKIAGFIHIGTPAEPPLERVRPDVKALTSTWRD